MWFSSSLHFSTGFWGPTKWRPLIHHTICAKCFIKMDYLLQVRQNRSREWGDKTNFFLGARDYKFKWVAKRDCLEKWSHNFPRHPSEQLNCALGSKCWARKISPSKNWKHWNMFRWPEEEATVSSAPSLTCSDFPWAVRPFPLSWRWEWGIGLLWVKQTEEAKRCKCTVGWSNSCLLFICTPLTDCGEESRQLPSSQTGQSSLLAGAHCRAYGDT